MAGKFFDKLVNGLTKTRTSISSGFNSIFNAFSSIDDDFYEELEEMLIMSDIGVMTTEEIIDSLKPENCTDEEVMKKNLDELVELVKSRKETDNISAVLMNCMEKKE